MKRLWSSVVGAMLVLVSTAAALDLPRGTLWRVEQACLLNERTTGSPFPCLAVNREVGYAVLRAPFRQTHIVLMPIARMTGIEAPQLRGPAGEGLFAQAWNARHFVESEVKHTLGWSDVGLAVNSAYTRSQDQLHIHVECVRERVKREIGEHASTLATTEWQPAAYVFKGLSFWGRRVNGRDLAAVDVMQLVDEIPNLRAHPERATLAILGTTDQVGTDGFVLLVAEHDSRRGAEQWTSEEMLDHRCRHTGR